MSTRNVNYTNSASDDAELGLLDEVVVFVGAMIDVNLWANSDIEEVRRFSIVQYPSLLYCQRRAKLSGKQQGRELANLPRSLHGPPTQHYARFVQCSPYLVCKVPRYNCKCTVCYVYDTASKFYFWHAIGKLQ
jgi:hypothetical protein